MLASHAIFFALISLLPLVGWAADPSLSEAATNQLISDGPLLANSQQVEWHLVGQGWSTDSQTILREYLSAFLKRRGRQLVAANTNPAGPEVWLERNTNGATTLALLVFDSPDRFRHTPRVAFHRSATVSRSASHELRFLAEALPSLFAKLPPLENHTQSPEDAVVRKVKREWLDPDNSRSHLVVGVMLGSPTLGQIYFGWWGRQHLPLAAELTGLYLNSSRRGFTLSGSFLIDNSGDWRHGPGLIGVMAGQTTESLEYQFDVYGNLVQTTAVSRHSWALRVGPHYLLRWRGLRLAMGWVTPMNSFTGRHW